MWYLTYFNVKIASEEYSDIKIELKLLYYVMRKITVIHPIQHDSNYIKSVYFIHLRMDCNTSIIGNTKHC